MRSTLESAGVDIRFNTAIEKGDEKELILVSTEKIEKESQKSESGFLPSHE
jgi:hypothetical protein